MKGAQQIAAAAAAQTHATAADQRMATLIYTLFHGIAPRAVALS
jgi:hypothetical protein